jgi:nitrogen fixation protein NifB
MTGQTGGANVLVAVTTKGGARINQHFGHASEFQIYELSGAGAKFVGHRKVENYCQGGWGEEDVLEDVTAAIKDCAAVFTSKIGLCPRKELATAGIEVVDGYAHEYIESSLIAWFRLRLEKIQPTAASAA